MPESRHRKLLMNTHYHRAATTCLVAVTLCWAPDAAASEETEELGGRAVSLDALLSHAAEHAPAAREARARRRLADGERASASRLLGENPRVMLRMGPRVSEDGSDLDLRAALSQPLDVAGQRGLRRNVARRARAVRDADSHVAQWRVHREVHASFHHALVARERWHVIAGLLRFQQQVLEVTRRRVAAGAGSPLDERLAEAEALLVRQRTAAARQRYRAECLRLAEVAGWAARELPEPAGGLDEPREAPALEVLLQVAREHNPRLLLDRELAAQARSRLTLAEREALPNPELGVFLSREGAPGPEAPSWVAMGTVAVSLPLFERGQSERAQHRAELAVAETERTVHAQELSLSLRRLHAELDAAAERVQSYRSRVLPAFEQNLQLVSRAFELGEIAIIDLLVARERFLNAELDALNAFSDYFHAVAALEQALGADPWPDHDHGELHGAGEHEREHDHSHGGAP